MFAFLFYSILAWSHGEDKPGPHGGFIRMPGNFHVEVVPSGRRGLKIFLLDMEWKNPLIKNSKVEVKHSSGTNASCETKESFFECEFSKDWSKGGILRVTATRDGHSGNEASYELPLNLKKSNTNPGGHGH